MNMHLLAAQEAAAQADTILDALDTAYLEDANARIQRLVMAVWDAVKQCSTELDLLSGDCLVIDAIYAVNDARRQKSY